MVKLRQPKRVTLPNGRPFLARYKWKEGFLNTKRNYKKRYKNPKIKRALTSGIAKTALNYGTNYVLKRRNR